MTISPDPWAAWKTLTAARIALGRAGGSLPTREWLEFSHAHARARDAVMLALDTELLQQQLSEAGEVSLIVSSAAMDRAELLRRPDLGRILKAGEAARLQNIAHAQRESGERFDLVVIVGDGLSAPAAQRHAIPLLKDLLPRLRSAGWSIAPIVIAEQTRVALQDEIGVALRAEIALSLLGERPGLSSPDSLGAYFVYDPQPGRNDAQRNCVSNIRPEGLAIHAAAETLYYLMTNSRTRKLSGFQLKDDRELLLSESFRPTTGRLEKDE